jgi:hypothetical protein
LHQHIERLRERFGAYPLLFERRARNDIPSANEENEKKTTETSSASTV